MLLNPAQFGEVARVSTLPKKEQMHVRALADELAWLRDQVQRQPSPWVYERIAAVEGRLAAHREEAAWAETQKIVARFRRG